MEGVRSGLEKKQMTKAVEEGLLLAPSENGDLIDWDTPRYYSKDALFAVSAIFTTLFGAILLCLDLRAKNRAGAILSIVYGIGYMILHFTIINAVPDFKASLGFLLNIIGGWLLIAVVRPRYIAKNAVYIKKPIWGVLVVILIIIVFFIILMFMGIEVRY